MKNLFSYSFIFMIIITIIVSILGVSFTNYEDFGINPEDIFVSQAGYTWPIPNVYYISSYFGYRDLKLAGSTSYHSGIDIPSPEGTYFLAAISGKITYTGFSGSGGYTIILENNEKKITYCHVSPNFLVNIGDNVEQSQVIGQVGPFNVYDVINNPYKDKNGNPTNGSTTGCHLHFAIKINNKAVNPLDFVDRK